MSSIKIRSQSVGDETEIRLLINHPMENGRNRHANSGELIEAHYITELNILVNNAIAIQVAMTGSMAKNPFFTFRLKSISSGDKISVNWIDNRQLTDSAELTII